MSGIFTYEYLPHRSINKETFQFYNTFCKINEAGEPVSVGFKYPNGAYKVRSLKNKEFYTEGTPEGLFGRDKFSAGSHKYVTITEGEYDALSLYQLIRNPVVSVRSSVSAARDCAHDIEWLRSFERIYLAFDSDEVGQRSLREVARLFDYNRVYHVKLTKRKDANDYLQHNEGEELRQCWWNAKKYLPENIVSSFSEFRTILRSPPNTGLMAYPSATLNEMTYGIRKGESVLVTAQEGVGKTEFLHSLEYNILKLTDEPVGAIYNEEPKYRHLQALAGLELRSPVHLPDSACDGDQIADAVEKVVGQDERLHLYSHFGSDDPDVILETLRFLCTARSCGYVLWDHIGMAVSGLAGEDERRALDYLSTRVEMMVKELNFALIFVSHVNDFGQTRGSRLIAKNCDLRINLTRDVLHESEEVRNTTLVSISKNRPIGKTGPADTLIFDPKTHTYRGFADRFSPPANDNNKIAVNAA